MGIKTMTARMGIKTKTAAVSDVLFGQTRGKMLGLLFSQPGKSFYFQEIRRQIGAAGVGAVQREIQTLLDVGLVERSSVGNQVFYKANRMHPVFPELRALLAKTVGVFELLRSALTPLAERVSVAFVYGSIARQQENAESDIDLMIIGKVTMEEVLEKLAAVETSLGRPINPTVYSAREFKAKLAGGNHFLTSVIRAPKVLVIGDENELRRVGGSQTAPTRTQ